MHSINDVYFVFDIGKMSARNAAEWNPGWNQLQSLRYSEGEYMSAMAVSLALFCIQISFDLANVYVHAWTMDMMMTKNCSAIYMEKRWCQCMTFDFLFPKIRCLHLY
jgi:hypothetical protein